MVLSEGVCGIFGSWKMANVGLFPVAVDPFGKASLPSDLCLGFSLGRNRGFLF